jgi:hypothetical protein
MSHSMRVYNGPTGPIVCERRDNEVYGTIDVYVRDEANRRGYSLLGQRSVAEAQQAEANSVFTLRLSQLWDTVPGLQHQKKHWEPAVSEWLRNNPQS